MGNVINIEGLVKQYGTLRVLDRLALTVRSGEVHAFPGPNGAGKSTTILVLLGLLRADSGSVDSGSVVREGRVVESGTLAELRHLTRTSIHAELSESAVGLETVPGTHNLVLEDHRVDFEVEATHVGEAVVRLSRFGIRAITSQPPSLEELFLRQNGEAVVAESADRAGDPA